MDELGMRELREGRQKKRGERLESRATKGRRRGEVKGEERKGVKREGEGCLRGYEEVRRVEGERQKGRWIKGCRDWFSVFSSRCMSDVTTQVS